jgi:hypothetical protein
MSGNYLYTRYVTSRWFQLFRYEENTQQIKNERGKVLDVQGGQDIENRRILMWNPHKGLNQKWEIIYVKDMPREPRKGEMNKQFGFIVESDFHLQTKMKSGRYLDRLGNNAVLKTPNGRNTQIWYFHQRSRTIRNKY